MLRRLRFPPPATRATYPRTFHSSRHLYDETFPNHYATLGVPENASASEIKKSFYALSKKHHPDLNPDPDSSTRFVAISEAYHVLGSPEQRTRYDRDFARAHGAPSASSSRGSYSSATGPAGARPASGLSRRRSTFRGPPPSFYKNGGWGKQDAKRAKYAYHGQSEPPPPGSESQKGGDDASSGPGGFGPGQEWESAWQDPDIPYWDRAGHKKTQEGLEGMAQEAAARRASREADKYKEFGERGIWIQFALVTGVITLGITIPTMMWQ